ncbi:aminotransferase class I/II-fold pyridoxal phosphate-dependent enzyme [Alkalibacter saccharofermentans]|uniref:Cystathionine beta-lyase family protein involved in aluminum resistance n=1 Tax=Alkalibacter saccharofermentans DSM 14828 TaxID=1120975 RepID=A0A1M4Z4T2_9FIRM|nr:methionine gamma-lyase family protein [Alkalibacter saccharofermentans]SHF13051.1 Cystathionine beta-lyase family protein involved in aluminum resistance [Alkalibacter saccharofermentans DSM 14828]
MQIKEAMYEKFGIDEKILELCRREEKSLKDIFEKVKEICEYNQLKVIRAMQKHNLSDRHFNVSTGYGYDDEGRDVLEKIYAEVFNAEDALVRPQIISGTHAISLCLYGVLRPGDELLSITGSPYDTVRTIIDGKGKNYGTLKDYGVKYAQIDLCRKGIDLKKVLEALRDETKLVYIQRSTGYGWRKALTIEEIKEAILAMKKAKPNVAVMVDNCYGEFLDILEPTDVGADLVAGSLIKNPGGGISPMGGYVAGKKALVYLAACRLSAPGIAKETGATLGINRTYLQGLFLAPHIVGESIKTAILAAGVFKRLGYEVCPLPQDERSDIIQSIKFGSKEMVEVFCRAVQSAAPVDSFVTPEAWDMPGYSDQVIMAAGAFIQGSSIELSADAPMREPYIAYLQGGLTHEHGRLGIYMALKELGDKGFLSF